MTFRKLVNRPESTTLASKINSGIELFGQLKCAYDVGRQVYNAGRVVAPYVARGISALL